MAVARACAHKRVSAWASGRQQSHGNTTAAVTSAILAHSPYLATGCRRFDRRWHPPLELPRSNSWTPMGPRTWRSSQPASPPASSPPSCCGAILFWWGVGVQNGFVGFGTPTLTAPWVWVWVWRGQRGIPNKYSKHPFVGRIVV